MDIEHQLTQVLERYRIRRAGFRGLGSSIHAYEDHVDVVVAGVKMFGIVVTTAAFIMMGHTYSQTRSLAATLNVLPPTPRITMSEHPHSVYADLTIKLSHCLSALKPFAEVVEQQKVDSDCQGVLKQSDWERMASLYSELRSAFPHQ